MKRRFDWLLSGQPYGPDPVCDIDLCRDSNLGVVPTLGALVPGWVLVIPRFPALSVDSLPPPIRQSVLGAVAALTPRLRTLGPHVYIFEHGPRDLGTQLGCGVDQAHVHVVPGAFDLFTCLSDPEVSWTAVSSVDPWATSDPERDYYLLGRAGEFYLGTPRRRVPQYFRRKIAVELGRSYAWDYREWPCYDNARRTLKHFGRAGEGGGRSAA